MACGHKRPCDNTRIMSSQKPRIPRECILNSSTKCNQKSKICEEYSPQRVFLDIPYLGIDSTFCAEKAVAQEVGVN